MIYYEEQIKSGKDEITLSIWKSGAEHPCIVFLSATMAYPAYWSNFLTRLAERGINIIGVLFIGHGKSSRKRKTYTFADLLQNTPFVLFFPQN